MVEMIPSGWRSHTLRVLQFQNVNQYVAKRAQTLMRKEPLWVAEYQSTSLSEKRLGEMQAFLDRRDGAINSFLVYDPRKTAPRLFTAAQSGTPIVASVSYSNSTVSITGMPAGLVFSEGDMVSWVDGIRYCLHRVTEALTTTTGTNVLKIYPRPLALIGSSLPLVLDKAHCEMMMIESSDSDDVALMGKASWKAVQLKR